jgi:predicted DCC family thiol-disulfide oxidoreductase YuxK
MSAASGHVSGPEPARPGACESSSRKIIVFDGVCVLCSRWVKFVLQHDRPAEFTFAAMQSHSGQALLAQHGLEPNDPSSFLLLDQGTAYVDSDAVLRVLKHFSWPWRALATCGRLVPKRWRDAAYRCTAHNRYRWFGRFDTCSLPSSQTRHRFLT